MRYNPLTKSIKKEGDDFNHFIEKWDEVEGLIIRVYRSGRAAPQDEQDWRALRAWLSEEYPRWQAALEPHWQVAKAAGKPADEDPFAMALAHDYAASFLADRRMMQFLPAAREAINRMVLG
ncbi:MAG TPA: hypothetical protein PLJ62_12945 [Thermoflexales bacterium]|nr:hypothetical protein [Thermoflexales bacterium]HQW35016.1 hypothetical protein [Thermoflexales bacterium]HQZ21841.1 hypothetical protein [Thermoflexales bacterium]HRA01104.1 hypothetical protein [Thermoflexales bacterium]